ncbi:putative polysaccharide biosynthesis domain protein, partial [Vibrio parahaemolyticus EKP-021]
MQSKGQGKTIAISKISGS